MHCAQSYALFLGKILKIRYFEIESGGTFCKVHTVMFISHGYVILPTTLNIKQVKSWVGTIANSGGAPPRSLDQPLAWPSLCGFCSVKPSVSLCTLYFAVVICNIYSYQWKVSICKINALLWLYYLKKMTRTVRHKDRHLLELHHTSELITVALHCN